MLDATNSRLRVIDEGDPLDQRSIWHDGSFRTLLEKVRQRRRLVARMMLLGAAAGCLASLAYVAIKVSAFSASSEILISNTTLQLSGQDAVVTQILVENSLVENAIALLRSGKVLGRVIDKVGLDEVERISPRHTLPWSSSNLELESDAGRRQAAIALLRSNTTVKRVGSSQVVDVRARALSAMDAARLTNEIAAAFVQEQYDANAVVTTSAALRERIKVLGPTARIISEAVPPKSKDSPNAIAVLLGIVLCGALGAAGGLALIGFDRRLRVAEQLVDLTSVECFGYVPLTKRHSDPLNLPAFSLGGRGQPEPHPAADSRSRSGARSNPRQLAAREYSRKKLLRWLFHGTPAPQKRLPPGIDCKVDPEFVMSRSLLRRVRSSILERSTRVPHIVGVTSCLAAEGKTTVAANLARFVASEGAPVLLIDACFPNPARGRAEGHAPGLQELLRGTATLDKVIVHNISPNLDFLPNGKDPRDLDLVWGNVVHAINGERERERCYEWVILDLPSLLATAVDVRAAGQALDDLLIVVEWGRSSEGQLHRALRALGSLRERLVGTIVNKAPATSIDSETTTVARASGPVDTTIDPKLRTTRQSYDQEKV